MTITPSDVQWKAVQEIVAWWKGGPSTPQVFYLAGYAGTGKSTILKLVLQELARWGMRSHCLMTFTGKAASVLRRKGSDEAMTAHAGLYLMDEEQSGADLAFTLNLFGPAAQADLLVFDECSMIDGPMGTDALSLGRKTLVLGDPGQLPPVRGAGFFTSMEPDVMLTEVHRQALESPILRLATLAREGMPIPWGEVDAGEAGSARVLPLIRKNEGLIYRPDTQAICGVHRVRKVVTSKIRHARGFAGDPMAGERIMCGKNNRERGLFNGLQGELLTTPEPYRRKAGDDQSYSRYVELDVQMEDMAKPLRRLVTDPWQFEWHIRDVEQPRMRQGIEWFDFGYVLTCHKSQGSEFDDVTIVDDSGSFGEDRHRWRYTAITRASRYLTILRRP